MVDAYIVGAAAMLLIEFFAVLIYAMWKGGKM
jgi:hypothetical protein